MPRVIFDLPPDVRMAIRLRAIKNGCTTGEVIAEAVSKSIPAELQEATKLQKEGHETCRIQANEHGVR